MPFPEGTSSGSHITSSQRGAARGVREGSCPGDLLQGHSRMMKQASPEEGLLQRAVLALGRMEGGAVIPEGFVEVSVEHISRAFTDSCISTPCQAPGHIWLVEEETRLWHQ